MTKEELVKKHSERLFDQNEFTQQANISIEYAISVLREVANPDYQIISDGQYGVISIPQSGIYDKIKELKSLLKS